MHTWRISFGVTLSLIAVLAFYAMARFDFLAPHGRFIVQEYWLPITLYSALAAVTFMVALAAVLRRLGLHDVGRKVDLVERSLRRGEGDPDLTRRLADQEQGDFVE